MKDSSLFQASVEYCALFYTLVLKAACGSEEFVCLKEQ